MKFYEIKTKVITSINATEILFLNKTGFISLGAIYYSYKRVHQIYSTSHVVILPIFDYTNCKIYIITLERKILKSIKLNHIFACIDARGT